MSSRRRSASFSGLTIALAILAVLVEPAPPAAQANPLCAAAGVVGGGVGAIGGAIGLGNPASDACNAVTDEVAGAVTKPVSEALKGIGHGVFNQVTSWVAEGATWLIEKVVTEIEKTTTPDLTSKGFLAEYAQMSQIAALLAVAMLLLTILEALAQGSWAILGRAVFINLPLAFLGTSIAFAVVQMLIVATDAMSHAIALATQHHSEQFFKTAIGDLSHAGASAAGTVSQAAGTPGQTADEANGAVAAPLFVTFLAAIIGAFAAFCVWIELIMRDAAVYVVSLFMPLSLAAAISHRWARVLRRTVELIVVIIGSKFVIVSIIALAAGLIAEKGASTEHILAAAALLLLACFAPAVLMKMVGAAEGAMSAVHARREVAGSTPGGLQMASQAQMVHNMARSNWGGEAKPPEVWSIAPESKGGSTAAGGGPAGVGGGAGLRPSAPARGGGAGAGAGKEAGGAAGGAGAGAAATPAAAVAAAPAAAVGAARSGAERLEQSANAQLAGERSAGARSQRPSAPGVGKQPAVGSAPTGQQIAGAPSSAPVDEKPPRPPQELTSKPTRKGGP